MSQYTVVKCCLPLFYIHQGDVPIPILTLSLLVLLPSVLRMHTMRFPLIRQNRSTFIGNLGLFWIHFYGLMGNAWY